MVQERGEKIDPTREKGENCYNSTTTAAPPLRCHHSSTPALFTDKKERRTESSRGTEKLIDALPSPTLNIPFSQG
ncbi:hypothetical protein U1Q18_007480, partial [Sarracenia purpurea var. burkii]